MMLTTRCSLLSMLLVGSILAAGCRKPPAALETGAQTDGGAAPTADHKDEPEEHGELPSRVRLSAEVIKAAGILTAAAVQKRLPLTVDLSGEVAADPDRSVRIAARVPGRIIDVRFKEGEWVKAGAVLSVLESSELARARAAFISTQARAQAALRNAERLQSLAQSGLAAGQEVVAALAESRSLEAEAAAAQRALLSFGLSEGELHRSGSRIELRAPIAGAVVSRDAIVGQTVSADHVLCEIINLDRAYFLGRLFEKNLALVRAGEAVEVRLNAYPREVFLGKVETLGKQLDPVARTVIARIAIPNREDLLRIGLFGTARVTSVAPFPQGPSLVVPLSAVTRIAEHDVVFVRQPDDDFEVHRVTLGRSAGGLMEILSGLRPGELVVVEGIFTLKSAVLKSTFGEED